MKWKKLGKVISPLGGSWSKSYCWIPFADYQYDDVYRIYFATRNVENLSQIGWVEININQPTKILNSSEEPTLKLGLLGSFDDSAVMPSWITYADNKKYFWYIAWMQGKRVPYYASLGLAISSVKSPDEFTKYLGGPILSRNHIDPYMTASLVSLRLERGIGKCGIYRILSGNFKREILFQFLVIT